MKNANNNLKFFMNDNFNRENIKKSAAALEALLFIYGEPLTLNKIVSVLQINQEETEKVLDFLREKLKAEESGLTILQVGGRFQLGAKGEFADMAEKIIKEETRESLTQAALETLSIIAYSGPLPRSTIDFVRGVNSSFMLRNLLVRGLIERFPDSKKSNVYLYRISFDLLKHLNLTEIEALPEYEKYKGLIGKIGQS